eukprot:4841875-Amphidinium_carterae.1
MTDRTCEILVGTRIVKGTTPGNGTHGVPAFVSFPATKTAKKHLKSCCQLSSSKLLPKNQARTNLYTAKHGYPRSVTIGLTVARGYGIAHQSRSDTLFC